MARRPGCTCTHFLVLLPCIRVRTSPIFDSGGNDERTVIIPALRHTSLKELNLGIVFGVITSGIIVFARFVSPYLHLLPDCTFHTVTGIPCPTCGSTRSIVELSNGRLLDALGYNPLFTLFAVGLVCWGILSVVLLPFRVKLVLEFSVIEARVIRCACLFLFIMNWFFLIHARI